MTNEVRQDEERAIRRRVGRNRYNFIGVTEEEGKALWEKGGQMYREEDNRYLVKTKNEKIVHYGGFPND